MQAGRLRERVRIEGKTETRSPSGAVLVTWAAVDTVWASVLPGGSGERFLSAASREQASVSHTVRMRWRALSPEANRLVWRGKVLEVRSVVDPDGRRRELVALCDEADAGGVDG